jgi:hypothetical protein
MRTTIIPVSLVVLGIITSAAGATTFRVDWSGSGDFLNIQDGIDVASEGDTVLVLPGTYTGASNRDLNFGGTNMVLMSDGGYAVTTIDCENAGRGLLFQSGEDTSSVVGGFTITKAAADTGAGAFFENESGPRIEGCLFLDNTAQEWGGGVCCLASSPIIRDCWFEQNTAHQESPSDGHGGGVACLNSSSPLIVDTDFALNESFYNGGGLYSYYSSPNCVNCDFTANNLISYGSGGGGAALSFSDGAVFTQCTFTENGTAVTIVGAGLHVSASAVTVTDCSFMSNTAGSSGGAHFTEGASGTLTGCTFAKNVTTWGAAAAGLNCALGSNPTVTNCTFADNEGYHIWCQDASPTIEYSILAFALLAGPVRCHLGSEAPHIHHCFVYGNAAGDVLCGGNFHDIENSNPLFCNRAEENYRLCENSPCLPGVTWPSLVGAHGQGCPPCENAMEAASWGAIKAMYR